VDYHVSERHTSVFRLQSANVMCTFKVLGRLGDGAVRQQLIASNPQLRRGKLVNARTSAILFPVSGLFELFKSRRNLNVPGVHQLSQLLADPACAEKTWSLDSNQLYRCTGFPNISSSSRLTAH
jgi:hypothetical protein